MTDYFLLGGNMASCTRCVVSVLGNSWMTRCLLLEENMVSYTQCVVSVPGNSWNVATDHKTDLLCRGPAPAQVTGNTEDCRPEISQFYTI